MKVRLELHPEAVREVDAAVDWYEGQCVGLGAEFFAELRRSLQVIAESPRTCPPWSGGRASWLGRREVELIEALAHVLHVEVTVHLRGDGRVRVAEDALHGGQRDALPLDFELAALPQKLAS